jgi:hypothetical protein
MGTFGYVDLVILRNVSPEVWQIPPETPSIADYFYVHTVHIEHMEKFSYTFTLKKE